MAKKFYTDINLKKNELQNAAIENLAAAPSDPVLGQLYFNTTDNEIYVCVDAAAPTWESMGGDIESVTAGAGLTGGGTDGAVTLDIGQGTGITVNADEIKLKNADSLTDDTVVKWDDTNGQLVDTVITDDGTNVGINNTSPSVELDVTGDTKFSGDSTFLGGDYIIKQLPSFSMGAGSVNDEYLVICKQVVAIPAVEELGEGESQSDYYQDATGVTGRIYFSRGSAGSFNNNGYIDIVAQVSKDSGNVNNFDLSEFKIVGDSLFFTQIEEIDIDGTKYLALKARASGGGSVNHFFFVGNLSDDGADTNILTRVRASDSTVTVTDPQPSGFPIAPYMRQDEDGNVGIGTGTPSDKLDVHGIIAVDGAALIDKNNNVVTIGDIDGADDIGFLDINTANASTRIFLDDSGNVGINTSTPLSNLHIVGENGTARIDNTSSTKSFSLTTMDSNNRFRIYDNTSDAERLTITSGGSVGINTSSPAYKLDVDGNLRATAEIISDSYIRTNGGNVVRSQYDTDNYSELESNGTGGLMSAKSGGTVKLYLSSYQDSYFTGGKVLIGTASSIHGSADLQIVGATGNYARIAMKDSDGTNQLAFIDEIEGSLNFTSQNGTSNGTIKFIGFNGATSSTSMIVAADGNVGIGTTSPTNNLHVVGNARAGSLLLGDSAASNTPATILHLKSSGTNAVLRIEDSDGNNRAYDFLVDYGNGLYIKEESTTRMFFQETTGNIGIGTTSPNAKVQIGSSPLVSGYTPTTTTLAVSDTTNGAELILRGQSPRIWLDATNSGDGEIYMDGTNLVIYSDNPTSAGSARLKIDSSGNVGIGTTSPSAKLDVSHTIRTTGSATPSSGKGVEIRYLSGDVGSVLSYNRGSSEYTPLRLEGSVITLRESGNSVLTVDGGNVGIGTTSPSQKLHINNAAALTATYQKFTNGTATTGTTLGIDSDGDFLINNEEEKEIKLFTNDTQRLTIQSEGNVGIGTTSPNAKLDVNNSAVGEYAYFGSGLTRQLRLSSYNTVSDHAGHKINASSGNGEITLATNSIAALTVKNDQTIQLNAYGTGYLKSDASGNITVDSDTIEDTLDSVTTRGNTTANAISVGDITSSGDITIDNSSGDPFVKFKTTAQEYVLRIDQSDSEKFQIRDTTNSATHLTIDTSGNVGIGTTSPGAKLEIESGAPGSIKLGELSNYNGISLNGTLDIQNYNFLSRSTDKALYINRPSGNDIFFRENNTDSQVVIKAGGNVGIGTTSPSGKLHSYISANRQMGHNAVGGDLGVISDNNSAPVLYVKGTGTADLVNVLDNTTNVFTIKDGGNVGIGVTSPTFKLQVLGDSTAGVMSVKNAANGRDTFRSENAAGTRTFNVGNDGSGHGNLILRNSSGTTTSYIAGGGNSYFNGGNVGIGTASPSEKLHVVGDTRIEGNLTVNGTYTQIDTDTNTTEQWNVTNDGTGPAVTINQTGAQDIMDVQDDGTSVFYIEDGGNVGIGTTDPAAGAIGGVGRALNISSSGNGLIMIDHTDGGAGSDIGSIQFARNTDPLAIIKATHEGATDAAMLTFHTQPTGSDFSGFNLERMRIRSTGSIRFNEYGSNSFTGTAAYALAVDSSGNVIETAVQGSPTGGSGTAGKLTKWDTSSTLTDSVIAESNGRIGIGTTTPDRQLQVHESTSGTSAAKFTNSTTGEDGDTGFFVGINGSEQPILYGYSNTDMIIGTNGSERMRITSAGNVGIGVVPKTGSSTWQHIQFGGTGNIIARKSDSTVDAMFANNYYINSSNTDSHIITGAATRMFLNDGEIRFDTAPSAAADAAAIFTNRLFIANGGNVGIGTTSPAEKLNIYTATGRNFKVNQSTANVTILENDYELELRSGGGYDLKLNANGSSTYGNVTFRTDGSERMRITSAGNVGIGTTSPSTSLHVVKDASWEVARFEADSYPTATVYSQAAAKYAQLNIYDTRINSEPTMELRADTPHFNIRLDDTGNVLTILDGGNVGIGTTSPSEALHISRNAASAEIRLQNNTISSYIRSNTDNLNFYVSNGEKVRITSGGNVGIGTTSPENKLSLGSTQNGGIDFLYDSANTYKNQIKNYWNSSADTRMDFNIGRTANVAPVTVMSVGYNSNVGIGTTSPTQKLTVEDTIGIKRAGVAAVATIQQTGAGTEINAPNGYNPLIIKHNGSELARFKSDGNVGIGTTSPSEKLEVNGNVKADNFIGGNEAGIYTFNDTVNASASEDIFSISNDHGAQAFRVTFVCSTSGYSVAKTFEVVHAFSKDPIFFKVVDTGAWNDGSADHDFDVTFATEAGTAEANKKKIICTINNNSTTINADIVTTVFLGGSPTAITVTAL